MRIFLVIISSIFLFSCSQTFYVVRHAEKAAVQAGSMMSSDVPLTEAGKQRAEKLAGILHNKKIGLIYSTNTIRTKSTAEPTANFFSLPINIYGPKPDSAFNRLLKSQNKNTLIVGHSNTVDDIVNMLCGATKVPGDLDESIYDNLYVIKRKGSKMVFKKEKY